MNLKNMRECDKSKNTCKHQLPIVYMSFNNVGHLITSTIVRHPRRGIRCRQYTFLIYLLRFAFCFAEIVFGKIRIGFYSARFYRGTCEDLIAHTQI